MEDVRDALKESEERYRFLAENVPVHIWTARPDGMRDYVTEQTARARSFAGSGRTPTSPSSARSSGAPRPSSTR
jgi:hypothetical protein